MAVVEQHSQAGGFHLGDEHLGGRTLWATFLTGNHEMHVGRRDLTRPAQAKFVVRCFGDSRHSA